MREGKKKYTVFLLLIFLISPLQMFAQSGQGEKRVTLHLEKASVVELFKEIRQKTGLSFVYNVKDLSNLNQQITVEAKNEPVSSLLQRVFRNEHVSFEFVNNTIVVKPKKVVYNVKGKITDGATGDALPGASVRVEGTTQGAVADADGNYQFSCACSGQAVLVYSFIGYDEVRKTVKGDQTNNVSLSPSEKQLGEVVVNGYFTRSKKTFTGAASNYSGSELSAVSDQNVLKTISALDPSFKIVDNIAMGSDPNTVPNIQIRGVNSLPNTTDTNLNEQYKGNSNLPTFILDGFEVRVEKIYDLDPNRIANISILKDASATAIYGSRASNGVVIIDTKAPKMGRLRLNYTGGLDLEVADISDYNLLNAPEKLKYEELAGLYYGSYAIYIKEDYLKTYNERLKLVQKGYDTDWLSKPLRSTGVSNRHSVLLEGGNDSFRYGVNLSYSSTSGVMKGSNRSKLGTGIQLQYNYKNLRFKDEITYDKVTSNNSPYGSFSTYTYLNPYYYPYDDNGTIKKILFTNNTNTGTSVIVNPIYNTTLNTIDRSVYDDFINNFSVEWNIMKGLKLKGNLSLERVNTNTDVFKPADHTDFINVTENKGSYTKGNTLSNSYDGNIVLSYFTTLDKHAISFNGGWNIQETSNDNNTYSVYGFPNQSLDHPSLGAGFKEGDYVLGYATKTRLMGFFGNLNYSFDDRYFIDASVRADGSSVFGSNKRWGLFWSSGIGWNIHNEAFLKDNKIINQLRLRASTGFTGNQSFYPYQAMMMYEYRSSLAYQDYIGAVIKAYGNKDLKWQRTQKTNIGVDYEFLNHRITGYFNYFIEKSKDLLVDVTMANYLGFDSYKENLGETENKGFDFNIKVTAFKTKDIKVDLFGNGMHYNNKLKRISSGLSSYNKTADAAGSSKPYVRYQEGASINSIWVVRSAGIDPATGNELFIRKDGSYTSTWSEDDYVPYKTTDPKLSGTFGLNLYYKGWELNTNFYYRFGGYAYNQTLVDKVENVNPYLNVDRRALYNRWKTPGVTAEYKRITDLSITKPTSRFVEKDNLLSGNSLSLAYTFQSNWIRTIGAQFLKLSLIANDFMHKSTIHREMGTTYPYAHHYTFSAQITF
jgi:TonB-linked SusC/RagA family outer membrane protein